MQAGIRRASTTDGHMRRTRTWHSPIGMVLCPSRLICPPAVLQRICISGQGRCTLCMGRPRRRRLLNCLPSLLVPSRLSAHLRRSRTLTTSRTGLEASTHSICVFPPYPTIGLHHPHLRLPPLEPICPPSLPILTLPRRLGHLNDTPTSRFLASDAVSMRTHLTLDTSALRSRQARSRSNNRGFPTYPFVLS